MELNFKSIDELAEFVAILNPAFLQVGPRVVINDLKIERVDVPDEDRILEPGGGGGLPTDIEAPEAPVEEKPKRTRRTKAQTEADNAKANEPGAEPEVPETTETHTLPVDESDAASPAVPGLDDEALGLLIAAATDAAPATDAALLPLLSIARDFISAHSVATIDAIKAAVGIAGVPMQKLQPEQRQLLRACLELFGK
ncbi:hypothetical protein [Xanthomonas phage NEB7]|nr:hypothetical protein [Xanthomonas phage NEB7]